ncbi:hypothetical protein I3J27_03095 [Bradyrhizobium xenonodulans]|uniref:Uncharacterized protein n=1 Tax=Bradyrhizobium xenonodulans TaxID=2736875 RepID=A0ABY7MS29_9BRAD|nr:hypothetical protein [Bradyrhizobium xenonodulans]WBL79427.1 hypothetical protein I3J27_03095 [Bradyrhizobium xenonodulans]
MEKTSLIAPCSDGGLIIGIAAIMPHAREASKLQVRDAGMISPHVFRKAEWWSAATCFYAVIASAAKQSRILPRRQSGLLRRFAPRNDGV